MLITRFHPEYFTVKAVLFTKVYVINKAKQAKIILK
jgi:hypothetical protein